MAGVQNATQGPVVTSPTALDNTTKIRLLGLHSAPLPLMSLASYPETSDTEQALATSILYIMEE